ncbi:LLM class flavin-dependent oxidoreductase [Streptomyces mexicanus]|uniref:LLM class flavin-dependent oxidoreductase n=1 Tax=Streptomyces mexicanus TaxID=178566 RepID=A0A7X1I078_9ACTN|nr:LLM class flavin-dependent oxidoreductase [Streptomyces mexicanus]MBC2865188.1 LLM class flavin-dependent oxidoreductase [Streptomyces mexicanus]
MLHAPPGRLTPGALLPGRLDHPSRELLAMERERGRLDALRAPAPRALQAPDPVTVLSARSGATERIGLVTTGSPSGWDPHRPARRHVSLDILSSGRAGERGATPRARRVRRTLSGRLGLTRPADRATAVR